MDKLQYVTNLFLSKCNYNTKLEKSNKKNYIVNLSCMRDSQLEPIGRRFVDDVA